MTATLWHWVYLKVAQEMAEVDVEQLPTLGDHDVVRVPVTNAQDVGGHTVAGTGEAERFSRLLQPTGTVTYSQFTELLNCASALLRHKTKAYGILQLHVHYKYLRIISTSLGYFSCSSASWCLLFDCSCICMSPAAIFICYCISEVQHSCVAVSLCQIRGGSQTNIHVSLE